MTPISCNLSRVVYWSGQKVVKSRREEKWTKADPLIANPLFYPPQKLKIAFHLINQRTETDDST